MERMATFGIECSSLVKRYHYYRTTPLRLRNSILKKLTDSEQSFRKWFYGCMRNISQTGDDKDPIALIRELHQTEDRRPLIEAVGGCLLGLLVSQRLRVAIACDNTLAVENQVQDLASQLEALHEEYKDDKTFALPFNLTVFMKAMLSTKEEWRKSIVANEETGGDGKIRLISADAYGQYVRLGGIDFQL